MMRLRLKIYRATLLVVLAVCWSPLDLVAEDLTDEQTKFFETKIRPVLVKECYGCHSTTAGQARGGLFVDTKESLIDGGDSGPAIEPGELEDSLLWNAINYEDFRMPPNGRLPRNTIEDFRTWIEMGAPDPRVTKIENRSSTITASDIEAGREFWSFKPPQKQPRPAVEKTSWPNSDIDYFVLSKLEESGLKPSKDADANAVLRRLSFDLVGLPPTTQQIESFTDQWKKDPDLAVESVVDQLLDSDRYGERWGRHWLDVARYAESSGKELNLTFPHAWRYRDYVIESFNSDKPYDRFIQEQIAGDLLPVNSDEQWAENLTATGFLAIGPKTLTEQNRRQFELDLIDEQIDVSTRAVLGISVACARCHDHKFDPIPQSDYYAISGIFQSTDTHFGTIGVRQNRRSSNLIISPVSDPNPIDESMTAETKRNLQEKIERLVVEVRQLQLERRKARTGNNPNFSIRKFAQKSAELSAVQDRLKSYDENGDPFTYLMGVQAAESPVDARLLVRGEFNKPAQTVARGFVQVVNEDAASIDADSSGRLELAQWMTSPENPLVARVIVNRIWQHLLGDGIVRSPENFGATGVRPTHPELLDYLALRFMDQGWSIKRLIKDIATSRIYRTSSEFKLAAFRKDPENKLYWRVSTRQLEAEVIRDSMLSISGALDTTAPHASIVAKAGHTVVRDGSFLPISPITEQMGERDSASRGDSMDRFADARRRASIRSLAAEFQVEKRNNYRSVYLPILRDNVPRSLGVFDFAESSMVIGKRESSSTPDQGLYLLNNAFVLIQSETMARQLMAETSDVKRQVEKAFLLAYGREATGREIEAARDFYREFEPSVSNSAPRRRSRFSRDSEQTEKSPELQKLSALCQAIMASAEFRYLN